MNNVAMNLVATMMQNKFSNSYSSSLNGANSESFTSVLSKSKENTHTKTIDQKTRVNSVDKNLDTLGKAVDKISHDQVAKKQENLQKLNRNKYINETTNNDKSSKVDKGVKEFEDVATITESNDVKEVKSIEEVKKVKSTEEVEKELTKVEEELIAELALQLNVNPEEIKELLNELQLTILNLFDMKNLQLFMTEALGASSPMELLVTDGASEKIQEVMKTLETTLSANPELVKEVSNMTNTQGENVETNNSDFVKVMETLQNEAGNSNQQGQQSGGDEKAMMEPGKAVQVASLDSNQNSSGFEGMLNQVVTQKTETIIMNGTIQTIQTEVTAKDVFDQIVTGMKVQVSEAKSNVTLQLQPHNLGKIALNLATENGSLTGHFVAESEAVKEVIEANLSQLKIQLQNQGIEVNELKITVGSSASFFTGQHEKDNASKQSFRNKNNKRMKIGNINDILADKLSEEMIAEQRETVHEDSSIELHA